MPIARRCVATRRPGRLAASSRSPAPLDSRAAKAITRDFFTEVIIAPVRDRRGGSRSSVRKKPRLLSWPVVLPDPPPQIGADGEIGWPRLRAIPANNATGSRRDQLNTSQARADPSGELDDLRVWRSASQPSNGSQIQPIVYAKGHAPLVPASGAGPDEPRRHRRSHCTPAMRQGTGAQ